MKRLYYFFILLFLFSCNDGRTVKFAVCTDVHQDLIYDATERIQKFVSTAEEENADFIIQLGDFCMPFEKNEPFLKIWDSFEGPKYHVLGNHDTDVSPKIVTQQFWGMEKSFYSFDQGNFHFVVLDANFFKSGENYTSYSNGNYYAKPESRAYIPPQQLEWLKKDIAKTGKWVIVFTHQSLEHWGGVKNREEVYRIFREANREKQKVIACFCGHDHLDRYAKIEGVHYIGLNSLSYAWVGKDGEYSGRFLKNIEEKYPNLKYTLPYRDAVFAVVKLNSSGKIEIEGIQSDFIQPGPKELGLENTDFTARITNRILDF
jgi:3',5'-cyclic AMP phosphodiesterase CpdA